MGSKIRSKGEMIILLLTLGAAFSLVYLRFASYKISAECMMTIDLSYKDGFISAGFIGTVYRLLNLLIPIDMFDYEVIYAMAKCMLVVYYVLVALFTLALYVRRRELFRSHPELVVLFVIFAAGMFGCQDTLGSYAMYEMIVLLIIMMLLIIDRAIWLIVPLALIGVLIHPSFLFLCMGPAALLMLYRYRTSGHTKYKPQLIVTLAAALITYIASELSVVMRILQDRSLLLDRTIVSASSLIPEWNYHGNNYINLVILFLAFSPYLLIGRDFFRRLNAELDGRDRTVYRLIQLGGLITLPEFVLKIEYGFFVYFVIMYYMMMLLIMIAEGDEFILSAADSEKKMLRGKVDSVELLVIYPLLFMPFIGISIMRGLDVVVRILMP